MKKIEFDEKTEQRIIELAKEGFGYKTIHKILNPNFSNIVIRRYLLEHNLVDSNNLYRKYNFNQDFFKKINTEKKAYWLGFLYADGNVSRNSVRINISKKDIQHLEKFKEDIECDYPVKTGVQDSFGTNTEYARLEVNSAAMVRDLIRLGCMPNKSLVLKFPNEKQVPKEYVVPFMRGYFDGDGSITFGSGKYPQASLNILGTEEFLSKVQKVLGVATSVKLDKRKNFPYLAFGGNKNSLNKLEMIYENANIYLDRKHEKYLILKNKYKVD